MQVRSWHVGALALAVLWPAIPAAAVCPGDCNGDGVVQVNEIVQGVAIALGQAPVGTCPSFDGDDDGAVSIAELLTAVNALLSGCSTTPATNPPGTTTPTRTPTPTATLNQPPQRPNPIVYRTYPDQTVALPLALDPEGGPLSCRADAALPTGMAIDGEGVLHWMPLGFQLGPLSLPFTCQDGADPPAATSFVQHFRVAALDACAVPDCAPERGCTATLPPIDEPCCTGATIQRTGEPAAGCPEGRLVMVGRNLTNGFGRLHNCDRLQVFNSGQSAAEVRFHIRLRCLNPLNRVIVSARLETFIRGVAINAETAVFVSPESLERRNLRFPIMGGGPFFDLDNAEANLTVTVRDQPSGNTATESVRVILGFEPLLDLPDP